MLHVLTIFQNLYSYNQCVTLYQLEALADMS
jgi:hypothetical protein